jgi:hypothetical protein
MNNSLKRLLVQVASLPLKDQHWLLKQLTPEQQKLFVHQQGVILLDEARRFAKIPLPAQRRSLKPVVPEFYLALQKYPPTYIAIILEQGQFPWAEPQQLPNIEQIKPTTKQVLFKQWQNSLNFAEQLEISHGSNS